MPRHIQPKSTSRCISLLVMFVVLLIISSTSAYEIQASSNAATEAFLKQLQEDGLIHVDHRPPPNMPNVFHKRQDESSTISSTATTSSISSRSTDTSSAASTSDGLDTATTSTSHSSHTASGTTTSATATYTSTTLPQPFDTSLGNNFTTTSCPAFFNSFLSNSTFKACLPVSLLLQNSLAFFQAVRTPQVLNDTLNTACSAPFATCSNLMDSIAVSLIDPSNCGTDYQRQNPVVTQAYAGLVAYEPMYKASCLKDNSTENYCFAEALTNANASASGDAYPYYTAIGIQLPSTAHPTCTSCLKQTMSIFAAYARLKEQPLAKTYVSCAQQVDSSCGSSFADTSVQVASTTKSSSAGRTHSNSLHSGGVLALTVMLSIMISILS